MSAKVAAPIFPAICLVLAVLLLAGAISPRVSGTVFAVALVLLGGLSCSLRK